MSSLSASPQSHARASESTISIIIPTFREHSFGQSLDALVRYLPFAFPDLEVEILVVDDSDRETQAEMVAAIDQRRAMFGSKISVCMLPGPRLGKGAAVRLGASHSRGDVVLIIDADLPVPLEYVKTFVDAVQSGKADVVIGERPQDRYANNRLRHVVGRGLRLIQRTLVFQGGLFEDTQCGFKAFRGPALRAITARQIINGGMYDLEYLYAAIDRKLKFDRVPVPLSGEVRASRINVWRCILFDPFDIIKLKVAGVFGRYK